MAELNTNRNWNLTPEQIEAMKDEAERRGLPRSDWQMLFKDKRTWGERDIPGSSTAEFKKKLLKRSKGGLANFKGHF